MKNYVPSLGSAITVAQKLFLVKTGSKTTEERGYSSSNGQSNNNLRHKSDEVDVYKTYYQLCFKHPLSHNILIFVIDVLQVSEIIFYIFKKRRQSL